MMSKHWLQQHIHKVKSGARRASETALTRLQQCRGMRELFDGGRFIVLQLVLGGKGALENKREYDWRKSHANEK